MTESVWRHDAVFISDLHLHPEARDITNRFYAFIQWAAVHASTVYILGDFFHVWPGDDGIDEWSMAIAQQLAWLSDSGVPIYFMSGNRDFLLGNRFLTLAKMHKLTEPTVILRDGVRMLLVHGDRYCTNDKGHQWLRRLTRNRLFKTLFLRLPFSFRNKMVTEVRRHSQNNRYKLPASMDVVPLAMIRHMRQLNASTLIHGHTHKPGITLHYDKNETFQQIVLSDWDENPLLMCYNVSNGFCFEPLTEK